MDLSQLTNYNLINLMFYIFAISVTVGGIFVNLHEKRLICFPKIICDCYVYGKLSSREMNSILCFFQVPKRWFLHFYITSGVMSVVCCLLLWSVTVEGNTLPDYIGNILDFLTQKERYCAVNQPLAWISLLLYSGHVLKRLLETLFVSRFSSSQMNVLHYIMGHTHYAGAFIGLVSLFPGFATTGVDEKSVDVFHRSFWWTVICVSGCIYFSLHQWHSLKILADLRKNHKDNSSKDHFLPMGGGFRLVSCPHMMSEMMVYFAIAALMHFQHTTWNVVCLFVWCNQIQLACLNHRWYKQHFKDYPIDRKAIIPYVL